jgi:putative flippase GtrA
MKLKERIKKIWSIQFIRFLFTGGINTIFGYGVYTLLVLAGLDYQIALLISTILGVIFNFFTTGRIVFFNKNLLLIFKFILTYIVVYIVNVILLKIFVGAGLGPIISQAICLPLMVILSYVLNKYLVFKNKV